jgi:hypothetical protein
MVKRKGMAKSFAPKTKGRCPYCSNMVNAVEAHVKIKHKGEHFTKKQKR